MKVGIIGLGMMGNTHLDVYANLDGVQVAAVADADADRLSGKTSAAGNIEGQAQGGFDFGTVKQYSEGLRLIQDDEVELVDICLPTPLHLEYFRAAVQSGKHVMIEKPVARTYAQAQELVRIANAASGITMPAMCMRFWPGWTNLKEMVDAGTYGKVLGATFRRVTNHPGGFYSDGDAAGGAILDLHIHDTDFIRYCFGDPRAVTSVGYSQVSSAIDHVVTQYHYDHIPLVVAEGGWSMAEGFGFQMKYTVNFERATVEFDLAGDPVLRLIEPGKEPRGIEIADAMGYQFEIKYLVDCIRHNRQPEIITVADAAEALRIIEAEVESVKTGQRVELAAGPT